MLKCSSAPMHHELLPTLLTTIDDHVSYAIWIFLLTVRRRYRKLIIVSQGSDHAFATSTLQASNSLHTRPSPKPTWGDSFFLLVLHLHPVKLVTILHRHRGKRPATNLPRTTIHGPDIAEQRSYLFIRSLKASGLRNDDHGEIMGPETSLTLHYVIWWFSSVDSRDIFPWRY